MNFKHRWVLVISILILSVSLSSLFVVGGYSKLSKVKQVQQAQSLEQNLPNKSCDLLFDGSSANVSSAHVMVHNPLVDAHALCVNVKVHSRLTSEKMTALSCLNYVGRFSSIAVDVPLNISWMMQNCYNSEYDQEHHQYILDGKKWNEKLENLKKMYRENNALHLPFNEALRRLDLIRPVEPIKTFSWDDCSWLVTGLGCKS